MDSPPPLKSPKTIHSQKGKACKNEQVYRWKDVWELYYFNKRVYEEFISEREGICSANDESQLQLRVEQLYKERREYEKTFADLNEENNKYRQMSEEIQDVITRIMKVITIINNDIRDNKPTDQLLQNITDLKTTLSPLGFEIYYYGRGESIPDDATNVNIEDYEMTSDSSLDNKVSRCDAIGYRMSRFNLRSPAKVILYRLKKE